MSKVGTLSSSYEITWAIEKPNARTNYSVTSPVFQITNNPADKFSLKFENRINEKVIVVSVRRLCTDSALKPVSVSIYLKIGSSRTTVCVNEAILPNPVFQGRNFSLDQTHGSLLQLPCGKEKLLVQCTITTAEFHDCSMLSPDAESSVSEKFGKMFDEESLTDVTFNVCGELIKAHRCILAARCSVFATMFKYDTSEVVLVEDVSANTMRSFLKYIYTGEIDSSKPADLLNLLVAANKYLMFNLKEETLQLLLVQICVSVDVALDAYIVAVTLGEEKLKDVAEATILGNAKEIIKSDAWLTFMTRNAEHAQRLALKMIRK